MLTSVLFLIGGLVLLTIGADRLVLGASSLALRWGISPLLVGVTIVAFGTSSPELIVSVNAALDGNGAIALGNVVGSNIFNILGIMGLAAAISPMAVHVNLIRFDIPVMVGVTLLGAWLIWSGGEVNRVEGAVMAAGLATFLYVSVRKAKQENPSPEVQDEYADATSKATVKPALSWVYVVLGLAGLAGGSELLVTGATDIAMAFGVSQAIIGLTIVAIGTSLPELATSVVAALKGESDIAVGNVVGSNIFNLLGILGIGALIAPLPSYDFSVIDLGMMVAATLVAVPLMRSGQSVNRWEGIVLMAVYLGYTGWLISTAA